MPTPTEVLETIRQLEADLAQQLAEKEREWKYRVERGRVHFEEAVLRRHRELRTRIGRYLRDSALVTILSAPLIYSLVVPMVLLDLWVTIFQAICFPIYGIAKVRRRDYIALDRGRLAYLNGIEKMNCDYCGYANGVIAYVREVAGRTEQYWCPIRHSRPVRGPHAHYPLFTDYGDAQGYHLKLADLRQSLQDGRAAKSTSAR